MDIAIYKIILSMFLYKYIPILLIFNCSILFAQTKSLRTVENNAFQRGEKLSYKVFYHSMLTGNLCAGKASLEIKSENPKMLGRDILHIVGNGISASSFDWFYKVKDHYETYIDEEAILPWYFFRTVSEGSYKANESLIYNHFTNTITDEKKDHYSFPAYTQDIISSFYAARTMNTEQLKIGSSFPVTFFLNDSVYTIKVYFEGRETIKTKAGTFKCLRFKPTLLIGTIFKDPYSMQLWISDDQNHIPVLVKSKVVIGSIKLELTEYSGLANPTMSLCKK